MWKKLVRAPKFQHLMMLHRALNDTALCLSVHTLIVATPRILQLTHAIGFF